MNAKQHLAIAERILADLANDNYDGDTGTAASMALEAQGHALVALASELGVPHAAYPPAGGDGDVRPSAG